MEGDKENYRRRGWPENKKLEEKPKVSGVTVKKSQQSSLKELDLDHKPGKPQWEEDRKNRKKKKDSYLKQLEWSTPVYSLVPAPK